MGRAGSRRRCPGCEGWRWRRARLITALEHLDDDHDAATARAGRSGLCIVGRFLGRGRLDIEQTSRAFEMILAACAGEEPVVADAVESARQGVEQKAADELVGGERHDLLAVGAALAIVLVTEGDRGIVEADEAAVRYRNAVGVAGQIGEHGLGACERRLGINDPALLADRREVPQKRTPFGELRHAAEEDELPTVMEGA